jgi:hypothetical protein
MSEFFQRAVVCNTSPVISLCKAGLGHRISPVFAARAPGLRIVAGLIQVPL